MLKKYWNTFLWFIVLISLIVSFFPLFQRWKIETKNKNVSVALDVLSLINLSEQRGLKADEYLKFLKKKGYIDSVYLTEFNLSSRNIFKGGTLRFFLPSIFSSSEGANLIAKINPDWYYLIVESPLEAKGIFTSLVSKGFSGTKVLYSSPEMTVICIPNSNLNLNNTYAFFPAKTLEAIKRSKVNTYFGIGKWWVSRRKNIEDFCEIFTMIPSLNGVLFASEVLPGKQKYISDWERLLKKEAFMIGLVDYLYQPEVNQLVSKLPSKGYRAHILQFENEVLNEGNSNELDLMIDRVMVAIRDRNVRLVVFSSQGERLTLAGRESFEKFLRKLKGKIEDEGYKVGKISPFLPFRANKWMLFLTSISISAVAGLLLMKIFENIKLSAGAFILGILSSTSFLLTRNITFIQQAYALLAALLFPSLSLTYFSPKKEKKSFAKGFKDFLFMSTISLSGGFIISALLAGSSFLIHAEKFRGVKLTYVVPLFIYGWFLFFKEVKTEISPKEFFLKLWRYTLTVKDVIVGFFALVVLAYYLIRTGNTSLLVTEYELKLRFLLNKLLIARPRTKEFLLGHPVMLYLQLEGIQNYWQATFALLGAIGQISIVNTFGHTYTPLWVSLLRIGNGVAIGLVVGTFLILITRTLAKRQNGKG